MRNWLRIKPQLVIGFSQAFSIMKPGGSLIISTPYHGYIKNLAISVIGQWDRHFTVEWDGGHIKFFSQKTISKMASEAGFVGFDIQGVGRIPMLWKSMVVIARKPNDQ